MKEKRCVGYIPGGCVGEEKEERREAESEEEK